MSFGLHEDCWRLPGRVSFHNPCYCNLRAAELQLRGRRDGTPDRPGDSRSFRMESLLGIPVRTCQRQAANAAFGLDQERLIDVAAGALETVGGTGNVQPPDAIRRLVRQPLRLVGMRIQPPLRVGQLR